MLPLAFTPPIDSNWTSAVIVGVIVGLYGWWQKRSLVVKVRTHGKAIADLQAAKTHHDLQLSRLTPAAHEKHCASTEQLHRALRVQGAIHKHHEPPKP